MTNPLADPVQVFVSTGDIVDVTALLEDGPVVEVRTDGLDPSTFERSIARGTFPAGSYVVLLPNGQLGFQAADIGGVDGGNASGDTDIYDGGDAGSTPSNTIDGGSAAG